MRMPFADPIHDTPGFAPALQRYGTMPCCRPVERKHRAPVPSCGERGFLDFEMGTATETEEDTPAFASSSIARGVGEDRLYGGMGDQDRGWGIVVAIRHKPRTGQSGRTEEHTYELQSLMRISYGVFFL